MARGLSNAGVHHPGSNIRISINPHDRQPLEECGVTVSTARKQLRTHEAQEAKSHGSHHKAREASLRHRRGATGEAVEDGVRTTSNLGTWCVWLASDVHVWGWGERGITMVLGSKGSRLGCYACMLALNTLSSPLMFLSC